MSLTSKLLFGQIRRHPARFLLTLLAVVASAGVVIWVVSGYDALVGQFDDFAEDYLGRYQFVVAPVTPPVGTSPPLSSVPRDLIREIGADPGVRVIDSEQHVQIRLEKLGADGAAPAGRGGGPPGGRRGGRSGRGGEGPGRGEPAGATAAAPPAGESATPPEGGRGGRGPRGGGRPGGPRGYIPPVPPTLVGTSASEPPHTLVEGRWIAADGTAEAAVTRKSAEDFSLAVGDSVLVRTPKDKMELKIVGIVEQVGSNSFGARGPAPSRGPATSALYVPIPLAERLRASPEAASIALVLLKAEEQPSAFKARWAERLAQSPTPLTLLSAEDVESDLETSRSASGARNQAYSATGIALLAALFIIFTALSMGVHERTRQFAVLRAVSLTPGQIGTLILAESLLLGLFGWLGGLTAGWGLLKFMHYAQPALFPDDVTLGWYGIGLSGACAFGGALAAAVLPAWRAMRINPVEAMSGSTAKTARNSIPLMTAAGLVLIAVNPLLVFAFPMGDDARYPIYVAVGCSTMAVGFLLLAPGIIRLVERLLGPLIARLLRINPRLLASELSSNLWRTVGTCVALTLGLGLFVSTQIWGYSMLQPFMPGAWVPDLMINFTTGSIPDEEFKTVAAVPGLRSDSVLPLAVEQPMLAKDLTGSADRRSVSKQDNVIVVGLDPAKALTDPNSPLAKMTFADGDRAKAAELMKSGRGCLVPDHFARESGLKIGDTFEVVPPEAPGTTVSYTIAGVVEMPGWHWMTKFSGLRRRHGRAGAIVMADFETVRKDFALPGANFFWTRLEPGASVEAVGNALTKIAERFPGEPQPINYQGTWTFGATNFGKTVRLSTPDDVRGRLALRADGMIWGMSQLPLVTLAIAGLGVLNTVMASIRARTWNIGVMRAVGLTPGALARLILAESLLTGLVACGLSLAFGIMAGWCGAGISQYVSFFGGLNPSLVIPWVQLAWGIGLTLLLCTAAALWPAVRVARTELLTLLQTGRSSM